MSAFVLKQDVVVEPDSNVKLPEAVPSKEMPSSLSNRVKLQCAVTAKLPPSKAKPSDAAFSMKMSPYNSTVPPPDKSHIPSLATPLTVMSDMMTNPLPLSTSISSVFEDSITMLSKTVFTGFTTAMESSLVKASATFITVLHPFPRT